jgi:hypothetical protein
MWFKITILALIMFLLGAACGTLIVQKVEAATFVQNELPVFEEEIFCEKEKEEKIATFSPQSFCDEYDVTLTFEQNLKNCDRHKATFLDI